MSISDDPLPGDTAVRLRRLWKVLKVHYHANSTDPAYMDVLDVEKGKEKRIYHVDWIADYKDHRRPNG